MSWSLSLGCDGRVGNSWRGWGDGATRASLVYYLSLLVVVKMIPKPRKDEAESKESNMLDHHITSHPTSSGRPEVPNRTKNAEASYGDMC